MKQRILKLKKSPYEGARTSVKYSRLFSEQTFSELSKLSFTEILKYLEEHGYKKSIDISYLHYQGFYLIEQILNDHMSEIYEKCIATSCKENKELLESYYQKYKIHNLLALIRCKKASEEDILPFLIGDKRNKEKCLKAQEMGDSKEAILYLTKKMGLDSQECLIQYEKGLYEFENFLYNQYYNTLAKCKVQYNKHDENKYLKIITHQIDLLNARTFLRLKKEEVSEESKDSFSFLIPSGDIPFSLFKDLENKTFEEAFQIVKKVVKEECGEEIADLEDMDAALMRAKIHAQKLLHSVQFGSPFYVMKYLFDAEREVSRLRILLKAKYLKVEDEKIAELIRE